MQIVNVFPREVREGAKAAAELPADRPAEDLEVGKLIIDGTINDRRMRNAMRQTKSLDPLRVVCFRKKYYVIEGRDRAMAALRKGAEKILCIVNEIEPETQRKEKPHYAHSAVVTDKPTS